MPSFYGPFFHSDFHSVATENIVLTAFASMSPRAAQGRSC
jgi:hypothetical protein